MKNILIIAAAQTVLVALTVVGTWFMFQSTQPAAPAVAGEGGELAAPVKADPIYISVDPAFVVNMEDRGKMRFLQMQLEVMSRNSDVEELMDKHYTRVRNDLILTFDGLTMDDIRQTEGKTNLQERARVAINNVLLDEAEIEEAIEAVYFTKFVVQ
ncbi:flagellar FliL protein [Litorivivens lipolytica]|uniref:Flagellar protein FliL n=1 Tax=Litorivivens lipolytica TaxID=1524264 RepID=A0A7W4W2Q5_9GAMM|nr:flagellar basal body-associated FliL family protein [Litorivivens lipolytica]MBB3046361.1 flagellar FliL protein [Litorivivens lipolytica]